MVKCNGFNAGERWCTGVRQGSNLVDVVKMVVSIDNNTHIVIQDTMATNSGESQLISYPTHMLAPIRTRSQEHMSRSNTTTKYQKPNSDIQGNIKWNRLISPFPVVCKRSSGWGETHIDKSGVGEPARCQNTQNKHTTWNHDANSKKRNYAFWIPASHCKWLQLQSWQQLASHSKFLWQRLSSKKYNHFDNKRLSELFILRWCKSERTQSIWYHHFEYPGTIFLVV